MSYVDGFVIPVPKKELAAYKRVARLAGKVWRDHGALEFIECVADDVSVGKLTSFPRSVKLKPSETVVFSWIVYKSRAHRDKVMKKVMKDPRIASTQPDLESRVAFNTTVRDRIATAIAATKRLRSFKAQAASRATLDSLSAIERTLVTPAVGDPSWRAGGLIARIYRAMGDPDYAPTRSERAAFAETSAQLDGVLATINRVLGAGIVPH